MSRENGVVPGVRRLVRVFPAQIESEMIAFTKKTRLWCRLAYPDHPNGCPNYCVNEECPEKAPMREDIKSIDGNFFLVIGKFNFQAYIAGMEAIHPDWSEKQLRNVLYWQNSVKAMMKRFIASNFKDRMELLSAGSGFWGKPSMEASGINVFKTLMNAGFKLNVDFEIKPKRLVNMVALVITPKERMVQTTL